MAFFLSFSLDLVYLLPFSHLHITHYTHTKPVGAASIHCISIHFTIICIRTIPTPLPISHSCISYANQFTVKRAFVCTDGSVQSNGIFFFPSIFSIGIFTTSSLLRQTNVLCVYCKRVAVNAFDARNNIISSYSSRSVLSCWLSTA